MVPWSYDLYPQTVWLLYELQSPSFDANASLFPLDSHFVNINFKFDVFLTVHHSIDFSKYQLSAQFF